MWKTKKEVPDCINLLENVFGWEDIQIWRQCVWAHWFNTFVLAFPGELLNGILLILVINIINCKHESAIKVYAYAPSMHNKSSITGNIAVFEDLTII